jgi:hypothetical protein
MKITTEQKQVMVSELNKLYKTPMYNIAANGKIYTEFLGKKTYIANEVIVSRFKSSNATRNVSVVKTWIEQNGGELVGSSSKAGSWYYNLNGKKVRISDHCWTSQYHNAPDVNLCSYDLNGHVELIKQLATIAN